MRFPSVLAVYDNLELGGIQTFLVRFAKRFGGSPTGLTLLANRRGNAELAAAFEQHARMEIDKTFCNVPFRCNSQLQHPDCILAFDTSSLLEAAALQRFVFHDARVLVFVAHPREFCPRRSRRLRDRLAAKLLLQLPPENIAFMNEGCRQEHSNQLGNALDQCVVAPLPVDVSRFTRLPMKANVPGDLVSVGRLTRFKSYQRSVLPVLARLRSQGMPIRFHLFGAGPEEQNLRARVRGLHLDDDVYFHGPVSYSDLPQVLHSAWAFLGMGTSVVQAAAAGVPALVAVESSASAETFGFLSETVGFGTGENGTKSARFRIEDKLRYLFTNPDEHARISAECRSSAMRFAEESLWTTHARWIAESTWRRLHVPAWFAPADLLGTVWLELGRRLGLRAVPGDRLELEGA
ncbi:MAG: glycosyltransferase [Bryobacteraceae bacterium]|nr:glycosyltransferase [Bryobacteraceae bacterium]